MEIKAIDFYGDKINGIRKDGVIYTVAKQLCENLGVDWKSQRRKIRQDEVLNEGTVIMTPHQISTQETLLIRADLVPLWLTSISANKVKPELKSKIVTYRKEAAKVLAKAFLGTEQTFTPTQVLLQTVTLMAEHEKRQLALENKVTKIETQIHEIKTYNDVDYMTVKAFAKNSGFKITRALAQRIGVKSAKLMREKGLAPQKIEDEVFGSLNVYPKDILKEVFECFFDYGNDAVMAG